MLIRKNKEVDDWGHLGQGGEPPNVLKKVVHLPSKKPRIFDKRALEDMIKGPMLVKKLIIVEKDKYKVPISNGQLVISKTTPKKYCFERQVKYEDKLEEIIQDRKEFLQQNYVADCIKEIRFLNRSMDNNACNLTKVSLKSQKESTKEDIISQENGEKLPSIGATPVKSEARSCSNHRMGVGAFIKLNDNQKVKNYVDLNAYKPTGLPKVKKKTSLRKFFAK